MYDKLGELLSDAIDTDNFPKAENQQANPQISNQSEIKADSQEFILNSSSENPTEKKDFPDNPKIHTFKYRFIKRKSQNNPHTGSVIKAEAFETKIPDDIIKAFKILDLNFTTDFELVKKRYRQLMLKYHPDTIKTKASNPAIVKKLREKQTQQISEAFEIIEQYLSENKK